MKVPVNKTVTEEVEVNLPIFGSWEDEVADGRLSWETRFLLDEKLTLYTVTRYSGERKAWASEVERLRPEQVGQYLKHGRISPDEFRDFAQHIVALFIDLAEAKNK